jgi:hypothetical protein
VTCSSGGAACACPGLEVGGGVQALPVGQELLEVGLQLGQVGRVAAEVPAAGARVLVGAGVAVGLEEVRAEHDELAVAERVDTVADTQEQEDQIGLLEGVRSRFGRTYAGEPDRIAEELAAGEAVKPADTVLFTVPNQLGVAWGVTQLTAVKAIMTGVDAMAPAA